MGNGESYSDPEDVTSIIAAENVVGMKVAKTSLALMNTLLTNLPSPGADILIEKFTCTILLHLLGLDDDDSLSTRELLREMAKILKEELATVEVDKVDAAVEGTIRWLSVNFKNRKEPSAGWKSEELYRDKASRLEEAIDLLMSRRFQRSGLAVFVLAANLHLGMLQDLTQLDPRVKEIQHSAHLADLLNRAEIYAKHAERTTDIVLQQRAEKVVIRDKMLDPMNLIEGYWWYDEVTGQRGKLEPDSPVYTGHDRRVTAVKKQLYEDLGRPQHVAKGWKELATNPIFAK